MSVELVLEGVRRGTQEGLQSARERLSAWRDAGVGDADKVAFDILVEMVDEFLSRGSAIGTPCQLCGPDGAYDCPLGLEMDPLCITCLRRLRDMCAAHGGMLLPGFGDVLLRVELGRPGEDPSGEWGYHATFPEWMPTIARIGIVPRRQVAEHSSEERGIPHAGRVLLRHRTRRGVLGRPDPPFPLAGDVGKGSLRRRPEPLDRPLDSAGVA